jgi:3-methylfumaryl-CoA hydratase
MTAPEKLDLDHLRQWIGRDTEASDTVTARLVDRFARRFDIDIGEAADRRRRAGDDPSVPAPSAAPTCRARPRRPSGARRLSCRRCRCRAGCGPAATWSFSTISASARPVTRRSTITDVTMKQGRTGALCFVTVEHISVSDAARWLTERQDIVYRARIRRRGEKAPAAPAPAPWRASRDGRADPVLLFRYSALTFNGHRIHYDRPMCARSRAIPA